jgi:hypothetical protein
VGERQGLSIRRFSGWERKEVTRHMVDNWMFLLGQPWP